MQNLHIFKYIKTLVTIGKSVKRSGWTNEEQRYQQQQLQKSSDKKHLLVPAQVSVCPRQFEQDVVDLIF